MEMNKSTIMTVWKMLEPLNHKKKETTLVYQHPDLHQLLAMEA